MTIFCGACVLRLNVSEWHCHLLVEFAGEKHHHERKDDSGLNLSRRQSDVVFSEVSPIFNGILLPVSLVL